VFDFEEPSGDDADGAVPGAEEDEDTPEARSKILTKKSVGGGDVQSALLRLIRRGAAKAAEAEDRALKDAKRGVQIPGSKKKKAAVTKGVQKKLHDAFETLNHLDDESDHYRDVTAHLRGKGPSGLDSEIRALGPWDPATMTDDEADELGDVLEFFAREIPSGRNFELLHATLTHFLKIHGSAVRERESLRLRAETVRAAARRAWTGVDGLLQEVRCALGFFAGQHGQ
jgi:U3 small nucleolar RNA-associated protein 21